MEIKVQFFERTYSISFGYKTAWFQKSSFFSIHREWYEEGEINYAKSIYHT